MEQVSKNSLYFLIVSYQKADANNTVMKDKKQWRKRFQGQKEFSEYGNGLQKGYM